MDEREREMWACLSEVCKEHYSGATVFAKQNPPVVRYHTQVMKFYLSTLGWKEKTCEARQDDDPDYPKHYPGIDGFRSVEVVDYAMKKRYPPKLGPVLRGPLKLLSSP